MKKITILNIFVLLLTPSFLLAGALSLFRSATYNYQPLSSCYIFFITLVLGILAILTFNSAKNLISRFPKITTRFNNLLSYLLSVAILSIWVILVSKYFWSQLLNGNSNEINMVQPIMFDLNSLIVVATRSLLIDLVFGLAISFVVALGIKKVLINTAK